jgi:hypothetical protein
MLSRFEAVWVAVVTDAGYALRCTPLLEWRIWSRVALLSFGLFYGTIAFCQDKKPLSIENISALVKGGVNSRRISQLIKDNGVTFEPDERSLKRLKQDGASDDILSAVKEKARAVGTKKSSPAQKLSTSRCGEILARLQLGEALSSEDKRILQSECK